MRHVAVLIAVLSTILPGCASTSELTLAPTNEPESAAGVAASGAAFAVIAAGAGGRQVFIDDPTTLPQALRDARTLEVVFAGARVPVARAASGALSFTVPANATLEQDLEGTVRVPLVADDQRVWVVTLRTAGDLRFAAQPIVTDPPLAVITRGLPIRLRAATTTPTDDTLFGWSFGATATGPWQAIAGDGKEVTWKPAIAGNFFLKLDALDRRRGRVQSVITSAAAVFVHEPGDWVTTTPSGGAIAEGTSAALHFNAPPELTGKTNRVWSAATTLAGPWLSITGNGPDVHWRPTAAGSYFVRVEASDPAGEVFTYVTPMPLLFASVDPGRFDVVRAISGQSADLRFRAPEALGPLAGHLIWSAAPSATGPWTPLDGAGVAIHWKPPGAGSYFLKVEALDDAGEVYGYTSRTPAVLVATSPGRIQVSQAAVQRGDTLTVSLTDLPSSGPYAWSFTRLAAGSPGVTATWTHLTGASSEVEFVAADTGMYAFRVELPDGDGGFQAIQSDHALVSVNDSSPILQTDPPFNVIPPGASVTLVFNARGLDPTRYTFTWFTSPGPQGPFTLLPTEVSADLASKRRVWKTQAPKSVPGFGTVPGTAPGQYFARVIASRRDGTASYTFTSESPLLTVFE